EYEQRIAERFEITARGRPADRWLLGVVRWAWRTRIITRLSIDLRLRLRQHAEDEAVRVFAENLRDLLLAAPAGSRPTIGLDPGYRTGVKVAVVDGTGKLVDTATIYPHQPHRERSERSRSQWADRAAPPAQGERGLTRAAGGASHQARSRAERERQRHRVPIDGPARG